MCPPRAGLGIPDSFCKASAPPPAHTLEFTLTRIHTRVGTAPPCPGQLGCRSPRPPMTHVPTRQAVGLGTHSLLSAPRPRTLAQSSLRRRPFPRARLPSQPGSSAPRGGHAEASFLSGAQGSLSLVTRLLSKPALNGCLFMAQSLARCILGSSAPASVCQEAVGPAVATTEAREPEGAGEAPLRKSLPGSGQRPPHTYKDSSHTLPSASSAARD